MGFGQTLSWQDCTEGSESGTFLWGEGVDEQRAARLQSYPLPHGRTQNARARSSLNHDHSDRLHQLMGNISRSAVLRNSWKNNVPKNGTWKTVGQLDCLCWGQEQRRSQSSQRMQRLWPLGRMKGIGTCTRGRKDDEKIWEKSIILQTYRTYHIYISTYIWLYDMCVALCVYSFIPGMFMFGAKPQQLNNKNNPRSKVLDRVSFNLLLGSLEELNGGLYDPLEDMRRSIWINGMFWHYYCKKCDDSDLLTRIIQLSFEDKHTCILSYFI